MENKYIEGKEVKFMNGIHKINGRILLVFQDALASGTNEYVSITFLSIQDNNGKIHTVRPRDLA